MESLVFAQEEDPRKTPGKTWKLIIADDDAEVHTVTKMVLRNFVFEDQGLEILSAYSGTEAKSLIQENPEAAVILLDVVMESETSGLEVVKWIREEQQNPFIRIILRTGQPGQAPEKDVINTYDINDYKEKTELTNQKLFTAITSSLRAYRDLRTIERNRRGLKQIIKASSQIFEVQSLQKFAKGVLTQMASLLYLEEDSLFLQASGLAMSHEEGHIKVLIATGGFEGQEGKIIEELLTPSEIEIVQKALDQRENVFKDNLFIGYYRTSNGSENLLFLRGVRRLESLDNELITIFSTNIGVAFDNLDLHREIEETQKEVILTLGEVMETRHEETSGHVYRVGEYAYYLAGKMGLKEDQAEILRIAAPMHDVGKIGIPEEILNKKEPLTPEDWRVIRKHPVMGYHILKNSSRPVLKAAAVISYEHHEHWDGTGYPRGLKGEQINLMARITCLMDVFDSLGITKEYKKGWTDKDILSLIQKERGKTFDPHLVDLFMENKGEIFDLRNRLSSS